MRWFLWIAAIIVAGLFVAHRREAPHVHRTERARVHGDQTSKEQEAAAQQTTRPPLPIRTQLRVTLRGNPEHTSMVMLFPADGGERVLPVDVGTNELRTFNVAPGRYRLALPGGIVLRELNVPSPPITIDLRGAEWTDFSVRLPPGFELDEPIRIGISGKSVVEGASIIRTRRIVHPRGRKLRFTISMERVRAKPVVSSAGGLVRLDALAAAEITFGVATRMPPSVYRIDDDGPTKLQTFRHGGLIHVYTLPQTQDLIVHVAGRTPLILRGVDVRRGAHDCGDLELRNGATLQFVSADPDDADLRSCQAHWLDHDIPLGVVTAYETDSVITLHGIPKGRIRIRFETNFESWTREYESTGAGTLKIKVSSPDE